MTVLSTNVGRQWNKRSLVQKGRGVKVGVRPYRMDPTALNTNIEFLLATQFSASRRTFAPN
jgi:hypothetical protein